MYGEVIILTISYEGILFVKLLVGLVLVGSSISGCSVTSSQNKYEQSIDTVDESILCDVFYSVSDQLQYELAKKELLSRGMLPESEQCKRLALVSRTERARADMQLPVQLVEYSSKVSPIKRKEPIQISNEDAMAISSSTEIYDESDIDVMEAIGNMIK